MGRSVFVRRVISHYHYSTYVRTLSTIATGSARKWIPVTLKWALRGKSVAELITLIKDLFDLIP